MINTSFAAEKAKLKEMNFKEKCQYIWEYYKVHIIVTVLLLVIIGSVINSLFINPPKRDYIYLAWIAHALSMEDVEIFEEELSIIVENPDRQAVRISSYVLTGNPQVDIAMQTRFVAELQMRNINGLIVDHEELMGTIQERVVYQISSLPLGMDFPIDSSGFAVPLNGSPMLEEIGIRSEGLYFVVPVGARNLYRITKALEVLLP